MERRRKFFRTEGYILALSFCVGLIGAALISLLFAREQRMQREIAQEILRFHVLANSDSREDQEEKLEVRDAVVRKLQPLLEKSSSREETEKILLQQMDMIEETAGTVVNSQKVKVSLTKDWFPEKTYGDCTFPSGEYRALRIEIGEARGHNWWCVLYPGLCFTDTVHGVVTEEGKEKLEGLLEEETYDFILHPHKIKVIFRWF